MPLLACRGTKAKLAINADCTNATSIQMLSALPNDKTVSDARNARVARFGTAVFCGTYGTCVTAFFHQSHKSHLSIVYFQEKKLPPMLAGASFLAESYPLYYVPDIRTLKMFLNEKSFLKIFEKEKSL